MGISSRARHLSWPGLLWATAALADGSAVDKVYHPYVEQLEWELEWRMAQEDDNPLTGERNRQVHRLGLGRAVSEYLFVEGYLIGARNSEKGLEMEAYELEMLWQLTEQGEFALDYGLLFELEREHEKNRWEYSTKLLLEREFGRFSGTANLGLSYEWGHGIDNEFETSLALQARYRYSPRFEPALELYAGEDSRALGPVLTGTERLGPLKALHWEAGVVFGVESNTPDYTVRALLEYEF